MPARRTTFQPGIATTAFLHGAEQEGVNGTDQKVLGGKDKSGEYYTAKRWWLLRALGMAYKSPWTDSGSRRSDRKFIADSPLMQKPTVWGQARDGLEFPWWTDCVHRLAGERAAGALEAEDAQGGLCKRRRTRRAR
jgi:hypothetical protein